MFAKKKYRITTESREILTVRRSENAMHGFCPRCQNEVEMLTLDAATTTTGKRTRELFRLIEDEKIHSIETERGHLFICRNSLEGDGK